MITDVQGLKFLNAWIISFQCIPIPASWNSALATSDSFKLKKIVKKPTRGENGLDQVYTNLSFYYESTILPPISSSDYRSILLQPLCYEIPIAPTIRTQRRECKASNKRALISTMENANCTPIYRFNSCEKQLEVFQSMMCSRVINHGLPRTLGAVSKNANLPGYEIMSNIIKSIGKRQQNFVNWLVGDSTQMKFAI